MVKGRQHCETIVHNYVHDVNAINLIISAAVQTMTIFTSHL